MVLGDFEWFCTVGDFVLDNADHAPGESGPAVKLTHAACCDQTNWSKGSVRPLNGLINSVNTKGLQEGRVEFWLKSLVAGTGNWGFAIRQTGLVNSSSSTASGYYVQIQIVAGARVRFTIWRISVSQQTNDFNSASVASGKWYRVAISWWKSGSKVAIKTELDFQDGNGLVQVGSTYVDSSPPAENSTCEIAFGNYQTGGTVSACGSTNLNNDKFAGMYLYRRKTV
jgi:hypothetical protein